MQATDIAGIITALSPIILGIVALFFQNKGNQRASESVPAHVVATVANCNPPSLPPATPLLLPAGDEAKP